MDRHSDMTELIGPDGIFLRTADRKRFDYVLRGVREDSLSLALSSDNDGLLDHYGRLLINKLRRSDGLQIEVFLPQNTEALLERFNQILADLSIDEARNAETSQAPRRVLLAHDAKAISERDLQLLSRLVQDFPGANVSLVLLVDKPGILLHEKTLEKFGQRMLRWPLEAPTREEGEALIALAGGIGFDVEAKKVLAATGYAKQARPPAPAVGQAPDPARDQAPASRGKEDSKEEKTMSGAELAAMRQKVLQDSSGRTEPSLDAPVAPIKPAPKARSARGKVVSAVLRWAAALTLLLLLVAIAVLLLFSQKLGPMVYHSPLLKDNLPPWAMESLVSITGKPPSAQLEESKAAAAPASVPAAGADSINEKSVSGAETAPVEAKADAKVEAKPESKADAKPELKSEAKAEPKADAKTDVKEALAVAPAAAPASAAEALAPRSERGVDQAVKQARPGSYFVQHVSLGSMAEAQEWRAQYAALNKSRIAAVTTQDQGVKYAVVSGPFSNQKEAESFAARPGVPSDPWLRPVKSLQRALVSSGR